MQPKAEKPHLGICRKKSLVKMKKKKNSCNVQFHISVFIMVPGLDVMASILMSGAAVTEVVGQV